MIGFHGITKAVILMALLRTVYMQSFSDRQQASRELVYDELNNFYSLRPVSDVNNTQTVNIDLNMVAIIDFDEQNGYIEISGYLDMEWFADAYTTKTEFVDHVYNERFWKPQLVLVNAIKNSEELGTDQSVKIRYNFSTKHCSWRPWIIIRSACTPDVKYYPFDQQSCTFKLAASGYGYSELVLTPNNSVVMFNFYEENGEWTIKETSSKALQENGQSVVEYNIKITRRPTYYVLNLLAPVILLGFLNNFVFILPAESGERISFAMTSFLAYVVLLTVITEFLPTSAAPLSYLIYYTFVMMLFSAGMALATIISLRIYHKKEDEKLPGCLNAVYNCCCCKRLTTTKTSEDGPQTNTEQTDASDNSKEKKLTWKKVAVYTDVVFFLGFLGGQVFYSTAYLIPLILNA